MKGKYRAGLAAVAVLGLLCGLMLFRPGENRVIRQARASVENPPPTGDWADHCPVDFSDPAVVIYGKNTGQDRLFNALQATYSAPAARASTRAAVKFPSENT